MILPWRQAHPCPPIQTSLTPAETTELRRLAAKYPIVLEIGAAYGYSTVALATCAKRVTSIDPHETHDSWEAYRQNLLSYGVAHKVDCIRQRSQDNLPDGALGPYNLVFIDGDHSYEAVKHDVRLALDVLTRSGAIACHDFGEDSCPGVREALEELFTLGPDRLIDTLFVVEL